MKIKVTKNTQKAKPNPLRFIYDDGGRYLAGYKKSVGDCALRAFCIITGCSYTLAYKQFARSNFLAIGNKHCNQGIDLDVCARLYGTCMKEVKLPRKMSIAAIHKRYGDCIVYTDYTPKEQSAHMTAILNGTVHDTWSDTEKWMAAYGTRAWVLKPEFVAGAAKYRDKANAERNHYNHFVIGNGLKEAYYHFSIKKKGHKTKPKATQGHPATQQENSNEQR